MRAIIIGTITQIIAMPILQLIDPAASGTDLAAVLARFVDTAPIVAIILYFYNKRESEYQRLQAEYSALNERFTTYLIDRHRPTETSSRSPIAGGQI